MTPVFQRKPFKDSPLLSKAGLLAMAIVVAGCNSNSTEAKQNDISATSSAAANPESDPDVVAALEKNFKASGFEQKITAAVPTQMQNIYWVTSEGMPAFFSDKEGKHIIQGQIVEIGQPEPIDISSELIANAAHKKLAEVDKNEMIIYPANGQTKAAIYVFTDADCPYCTKLHSEMDQINDLGIEVRYLAWPRSEQSVPKMKAIWCSDDRVKALTQAKLGLPIATKSCDDPVRKHMQLGLSLGVSGTPAIFTESGQQIGGYLPAQQLAQAAIAN